MNVVGPSEEWFKSEYRKTAKKLDMGKSCVRFKKLDDLPLDLVGEALAASPADEMIGFYKRPGARAKPGEGLIVPVVVPQI